MKRTVLITGATKGIGLETSKQLAAIGYQVIGIARSAPEKSFPGLFIPCDLSSIEQTEKVLQSIKASHHVDAVVNNVGVAHPQWLGEIDLKVLHEVLDLNIRVAVQVAQAFVSQMKEKKWGRIINIASRSVYGVRGRTGYVSAKNGLVGCIYTWALELASYNITANAVSPGPTETELFHLTRPKGSDEEKIALAAVPMGRLGRPSEIAAAIVFLISEEASFITGQNLFVDGGASL